MPYKQNLQQSSPLSQAAYRKGRGTIEHSFCTESLIIDKTSTLQTTTFTFMLDMSKAFDMVDKKKLQILRKYFV